MAVYADKAYKLAKAKQKAEPKQAYWAYWLAKASEQTHRKQEAFKYYRKAHQLEPIPGVMTRLSTNERNHD